MEEIRALVRRHLPGREVRSVVRLGAGPDNVVYEVDGELIVRESKADPGERGELVRREARLLGVVGAWSTLPVPELVFADEGAGVLAYVKLPGRPLNQHPVAEPAGLAPVLGGFVSRLHQAPAEEMAKLVPRDDDSLVVWLEDAEQAYRQAVDRIPAGARTLVEDFLGRTPPEEPRIGVFCHNDLGAEHVLVDGETSLVTGIIDWTDAAIADPAHDLARLYRDLGPEILDHYTGPWGDSDVERTIFYARCALLEDIAYGLSTGQRHYAEAALAGLGRVFA